MINYYYELEPDTKLLGRPVARYLAQFDRHPGLGNFNWNVHDQTVKVSRRVWLENANGVSLVKGSGAWDPVEFTWIKLKCIDIENLL